MTNNSVEGKRLNYLLSFYLPECGVNSISKIGFGMGALKRENHRSGSTDFLPGAPYQLKIGDQWSPKIPYENPKEFLTFEWFKSYVMCKDQPWICNESQ